MAHTTYRLAFESFGVVAEVVCEDRELAAGIPDALPPGWCGAQDEPSTRFGVSRGGVITIDGTEVPEERSVLPLLSRFSSVVRHHVAQHAPAHVFIHAGVVAVDDCAIVIPGYSRSGKTTLVAELVRAGATYYSDEYAVVNSEGLISPFAKPLSIRSEGEPDVRTEVTVPVDRTASGCARARLIVLTSYKAGAEWRPKERTKGEGAYALFKHSVAARQRSGEVLTAVSQLSRDGDVISGVRSDASQVAQALLDRARLQASMH
jgi:hypothetical protein